MSPLDRTFRALELFCCSGGLAAGFRAAGIEFELAIDASADACESYEKNLGRRPLRLDVDDLLRMVRAGWHPGPLDLVVADPPCAPWSRAGKRQGLGDERDALETTVELVRLLRPRAYLIGNIPGLEDANHLGALRRTIGSLAVAGYCVADFARIDAADFGVPQHRLRPFWYGHLDGPCIRWPAPTHGDVSRPTLPGMPAPLPWVTCRSALAHLPPERLGRPVMLRQRAGKAARAGAGDNKVLAWPWDRPSTVVCAGIDKIAPAGEHAGQFGPNAVILSERAAAILQGFPEGWVFAGKTKRARWAQIGQAVPPAVAEAIGRSVHAALDQRGCAALRGLTAGGVRS